MPNASMCEFVTLGDVETGQGRQRCQMLQSCVGDPITIRNVEVCQRSQRCQMVDAVGDKIARGEGGA